MPKVYLSPPYHKWNVCAVSGCDETTHNNQYLDQLEIYFKANGIDYKRGPKRVPKSDEDGTALMVQAVKESNAYAPDIHYVSHTNAANGTAIGYRPIIYPGYSSAEKLAEIMIKYRKEVYNSPVTLNRRTDLYELYATNAIAYYEEHIFHDNKEDADWFHANMQKIAETTCKAFCEYFNIPFTDPYKDLPQEKTSQYRVRKSADDKDSQIGAFAVLKNAIATAQKAGFNVYDLKGNLVWQYEEETFENDKNETEISNEKQGFTEKETATIKRIISFFENLFSSK